MRWVLVGLVAVACGDARPLDSPFKGDDGDGGSGETTDARACALGETRECVGPGACAGGQVCLEDGSGFGPCDCGPTSDVDAMAPASDAGTGGATSTGGTTSTGGVTSASGGMPSTGGTTATGGTTSDDAGPAPDDCLVYRRHCRLEGQCPPDYSQCLVRAADGCTGYVDVLAPPHTCIVINGADFTHQDDECSLVTTLEVRCSYQCGEEVGRLLRVKVADPEYIPSVYLYEGDEPCGTYDRDLDGYCRPCGEPNACYPSGFGRCWDGSGADEVYEAAL